MGDCRASIRLTNSLPTAIDVGSNRCRDKPAVAGGICNVQPGTDRSFARRRFLCGCCASVVVGFTPAAAPVAVADQVVPISLEPHHHERFKNEYLRVVEVVLDPTDATLFHRNELDFAYAVIQGAELKNEVLNNPEAAIVRVDTNAVGFAARSSPRSRRSTASLLRSRDMPSTSFRSNRTRNRLCFLNRPWSGGAFRCVG